MQQTCSEGHARASGCRWALESRREKLLSVGSGCYACAKPPLEFAVPHPLLRHRVPERCRAVRAPDGEAVCVNVVVGHAERNGLRPQQLEQYESAGLYRRGCVDGNVVSDITS